ncbi:hypothetical protein FGG08_000363 [Glutinoglossum americanum]|uniref:Uncharacterized protein n=1 Tax=Glutinoglossum americanum TaxID=1670608 RepID=A0A9P8L6W4_9PEZI|nr:hypothetical protein FGG08_000363 [Glutinoglossum americanum]
MTEPQNLRTLFASAESRRKQLEIAVETSSSAYQESLSAAIATYDECRRFADDLALFSPNETVDDISSGDLQYMPIDYYLAELIIRDNVSDRKSVLQQAQRAYERYLQLLETYDILSNSDRILFERFLENRESFSTASTTDAAARRETKIARFREEKAMKRKLQPKHLAQNPSALQNDDSTLRDLQLTNITFCAHQAFQSLESISQELQILAMAPPAPPPGTEATASDHRKRNGAVDRYSNRLDPPIPQLLAGGKAGPILSKDGKPLRLFTLLDTREQLRKGVFRPGHNLPTMTIDEYLEEERRRGGVIEGGGEASGMRPEPDEDNYEKADEETMKARAWDEFTEANPKYFFGACF